MNKKLIAVLVSSVGFCGPAHAAQQSVTQIGTLTGKNQLEVQKAAVNTRLGVIESNRQDHETRISGVESGKEPAVYVGETAPADTTKLFLDSNEEAGVLVQKKYVTGTGWVRVGSYGVQYASSCAGIAAGMCIDSAGKLYYHNGTAVVEVGTGSGGASAIDDLTDVDTTGKSVGKILKFDASGNLVVGTDNTGSGSVPDGTVNGQVLLWSTDQWVASTFPGIAAYPGSGIAVSTGGAWGTSLTLDTDLSIVSANDDSLPSAKAAKAELDLKADKVGTALAIGAATDINWMVINDIAATAIENGKRYIITTVGTTDFTAIGASASKINQIFTATGAGIGTGVVSEVIAVFTNTGSPGDTNDDKMVPTLERSGALFAAIGHNHSGVYEPADATILKSGAIGSTVQGYDADLTTWASVSSSANGRSLVSAADYAAMRGLLDLEAGTDFNAYDADLSDLADGSLTASKVGNGYYVADDCSTVSSPATGAICDEY